MITRHCARQIIPVAYQQRSCNAYRYDKHHLPNGKVRYSTVRAKIGQSENTEESHL